MMMGGVNPWMILGSVAAFALVFWRRHEDRERLWLTQPAISACLLR